MEKSSPKKRTFSAPVYPVTTMFKPGGALYGFPGTTCILAILFCASRSLPSCPFSFTQPLFASRTRSARIWSLRHSRMACSVCATRTALSCPRGTCCARVASAVRFLCLRSALSPRQPHLRFAGGVCPARRYKHTSHFSSPRFIGSLCCALFSLWGVIMLVCLSFTAAFSSLPSPSLFFFCGHIVIVVIIIVVIVIAC